MSGVAFLPGIFLVVSWAGQESQPTSFAAILASGETFAIRFGLSIRLCGRPASYNHSGIAPATSRNAAQGARALGSLAGADGQLPRPRIGAERFLALGPVSRILFRAFRRIGRHFSRALSGPPGRPARGETARGRTDATYPRLLDGPPSLLFCLAPEGDFHAARLAAGRGGLLPHLFTLAWRLRGAARRFVFCDTVRRRGFGRDACACLSARAASCPAVSGLSSPNFYRARRYPRLGIKELGATTRPQS